MYIVFTIHYEVKGHVKYMYIAIHSNVEYYVIMPFSPVCVKFSVGNTMYITWYDCSVRVCHMTFPLQSMAVRAHQTDKGSFSYGTCVLTTPFNRFVLGRLHATTLQPITVCCVYTQE